MRYLALACDYDGTLALHGRVSPETVAALERVVASGRKLILVTGRQLDDLFTVFPNINLFERVVAENGALVYRPGPKEEQALADPPVEEFVRALRAKGVEPLSVGRAIVATWSPHETTVLEAIKEMGLELQVIFNKGAVMILPTGINKATGLKAALWELGLSAHNVVGVGDAENDHAFLSLCECSFAVANALPTLKQRADIVTAADHGAGVEELIEHLIATDLYDLDPGLARHHLPLGIDDKGNEVAVSPYGINLLLAGPSGSGKSTFATGFMERLGDPGYQYCVIDPEGDYENFEGAIVLGDSKTAPPMPEVLQLLENPRQNAVVNLVGMRLEDRPAFFASLLPRLQEMRVRTGRPHWLIVDEAHHLLPTSWEPAGREFLQQADGILFITVHPEWMSALVLSMVDTVVAVGKNPGQTLKAFSDALGQPPPVRVPRLLENGMVVAWLRQNGRPPTRLRTIPGRSERLRHRRKYAEGDLGAGSSFYFRGSKDRLKLQAQNLIMFMQLGEGVDEETWAFHLHRGDYERWFREVIKNPELADEVHEIARNKKLSAAVSRALVRAAIEQRYTMPSSPPFAPPSDGNDARQGLVG